MSQAPHSRVRIHHLQLFAKAFSSFWVCSAQAGQVQNMGNEMPPWLPFTNDRWELVHIHLDDLTPQAEQLQVPAFTLSPGGPHWIQLSCLCGDLFDSVLCWLPSFPYLDTTLPGFLG